MKIDLNFRSSLPIYLQIVEQIQNQVLGGALQLGDQLPTVRQLALDLRVNFNTVARAYRMLDEARLISTQQGRGTYIMEKPTKETSKKLRETELEKLFQRVFYEAAHLGCSEEEIGQMMEKEWRAWRSDHKKPEMEE